MARSCAGWAERPTNAEFYDAIRAVEPNERERAIVGVFARESETGRR